MFNSLLQVVEFSITIMITIKIEGQPVLRCAVRSL